MEIGENGGIKFQNYQFQPNSPYLTGSHNRKYGTNCITNQVTTKINDNTVQPATQFKYTDDRPPPHIGSMSENGCVYVAFEVQVSQR